MQAMERMRAYLQVRKDKGLYRSLKWTEGLVDLSSNDYLGLSRSAWIAQQTEQAMQACQWLPQGATASRLLNGNNALIEDLEQEIAAFHSAEAALIFNSGFDANTGLIAAVVRPEDVVFLDEHSHASIFQGARLSGAVYHTFRHNDIGHLQSLLQEPVAGGVKWVVTESLFSMDGDRSPLKLLAATCLSVGAQLIVDEAHATGIFGPKGSGLCNAEGISAQCFARIFTFGKALGAHGAAVVGADVLKDYLVNFAKPLIYSTALPVHSLLRIKWAYKYLQNHDRQQKLLLNLLAFFETQKVKIPYSIVGEGPVFGIIIPGSEQVRAVAKTLQNRGFDARPIVYPTVARGMERIRLSLHSFNTREEIEALTAILAGNS